MTTINVDDLTQALTASMATALKPLVDEVKRGISSQPETKPTTTVSATVTSKKNYAAAPAKYDGDVTKFNSWMTAVGLYVEAIDDEGDKISAAMSYMTLGDALTWVQGFLHSGERIESWYHFTRLLRERFEDPDHLQKKRDELMRLRVVDWDVRAYFTKFEELATLVKIPFKTKFAKEPNSDEEYPDQILSELIFDRIKAAMPKPLESAIETALEAEAGMVRRFAEDMLGDDDDDDKESKKKEVRKAFKASVLTYERFREHAIKLAPKTKPASPFNKEGKGRTSSDRKATQGSAAKKEEGGSSSKEFKGTCFNCGERGHRATECPQPNKKAEKKKAAVLRSLSGWSKDEIAALLKEHAALPQDKAKEDFPKDQ